MEYEVSLLYSMDILDIKDEVDFNILNRLLDTIFTLKLGHIQTVKASMSSVGMPVFAYRHVKPEKNKLSII